LEEAQWHEAFKIPPLNKGHFRELNRSQLVAVTAPPAQYVRLKTRLNITTEVDFGGNLHEHRPAE
jgi:hypothetical protein